MLNKKIIEGWNLFYDFVLKGWTVEPAVESVNMVIKNKICVCRERMGFENVRTCVDLETAVQFIIFITFGTFDKTCSKIEKSLVSISSMGGKYR